MQKIFYTPQTQKKISRKFGSHRRLYAKYDPKIPESPKREYMRFCSSCMKVVKEELLRILPEIQEKYRKEYKENIRQDSKYDFSADIDAEFEMAKDRVKDRFKKMGLLSSLDAYAGLTRKLTIKEFRKVVHATIGIDITEDYYKGDIMKSLMNDWISANVDLISTLPDQSLNRMKEVVKKGYLEGKTTTRMTKDIMEAYNVTKNHAKFIARDQIESLNGQIAKRQQRDAGITKYIWSTCEDERVRDSHADLDGKIFSWDDPPMNERGEYIEPGSDYNCRCIARPVFDMETLSLPLEDE